MSLKIFLKKEKILIASIFSFSQTIIASFSETIHIIQNISVFLSANAFNVDLFKFKVLGK